MEIKYSKPIFLKNDVGVCLERGMAALRHIEGFLCRNSRRAGFQLSGASL